MAPQIAVVVATRNRCDRLNRLIGALEDQTGAPTFELAIVDDSSIDGTWNELQRLAAESTIPIRPLRTSVASGPAVARNAGWRASDAPLIAFTDDDCVPDPGWLAALAAALRSVDIAQGRTRPDPAQVEGAGPWSHTMRVSGENGYYETCNVGYRRDVVDRLGGFDESFRYPYGEDSDLAWRAKRDGASSAFADNAVVFHDVTDMSFAARLRQARRLEGVAQLLVRHPDKRWLLHNGRWFRSSHPPALLAGIGIAVGAVTRKRSAVLGHALTALACVPYVRIRTGRSRLVEDPIQNLSLVPLALIEDLAQVAVLARSSVKFRTLVL